MAGRSKLLQWFGLVFVGLFGLGFLGLGAFLLSSVVADIRIARTWSTEIATIQAVGEPRSGRGGEFFPVVLHVRRLDGTVVVGRPERSAVRPTQAYFLGPRRDPEIGDRVAVYVSVGASPRIVPAERLRGFFEAALIIFICGLAAFGLLMSLPGMWRVVREVAPPAPDAPANVLQQTEARRRKAGRRVRR